LDVVNLEAEPRCQVHTETHELVEGDVLSISCTVSYTSNLSPILMNWTREADGPPVASNTTLDPGFTESTISIIAVPPTVGAYKCLAYFDVPDNPQTTAKNAPSYSFTYLSSVLNIACMYAQLYNCMV